MSKVLLLFASMEIDAAFAVLVVMANAAQARMGIRSNLIISTPRTQLREPGARSHEHLSNKAASRTFSDYRIVTSVLTSLSAPVTGTLTLCPKSGDSKKSAVRADLNPTHRRNADTLPQFF